MTDHDYARRTMAMPSSAARSGNLPAELTSFVGRGHELDEIKRVLAGARLVTLTGVGGAGKTRLAVRAAAVISAGFSDGAWFVDLTGVEDARSLSERVASTLGLHDHLAGSPTEAVIDYLADRDTLLILDNCDHLRDECAVLAELILRRAPGLRILATSRHTLGVTGEHVLSVPPLTIPDGGETVTPGAVERYEALNLLAERARAASPKFRLTEATLPAAVTLCQQLDGIPLAIELAAARLRAMSLQELVDGLEDRYRLLISRSPSVTPRHRTLRELIGWSWDLCSEDQRALWARASLFGSAFDIEAAEAICADDSLDPYAVREAVSGLVDRSILATLEVDGRVRYRMLETLRHFGTEKLEERGERITTRERFCAHYCNLALTAGRDWFTDRQVAWLLKLRLEQPHLRASLETCFEDETLVDAGLEVVSALWFFWIANGQTHEARRWLERGLAMQAPGSAARTRSMVMCAYLCVQQEDLSTATPLGDAAAGLAADEDGQPNLAWATQVQGMVALCRQDLDVAESLLTDALAQHRDRGDDVGEVDALFFLATLCTLRGDRPRAGALYRDAVLACERHGETWTKGYLLWGLGLAAWQEGDAGRATAHARAALRTGRQLRDPWAIAFCLELLAWTASTDSSADHAAQLLGGARQLWRRLGWNHAGVPLYYGMRELTDHHDACLATVRDHLGEATFQNAIERGAALPLDELIGLALDEARADTPIREVRRTNETPVLTRREHQVAELVSRGLTNREIAGQLVISQRTAEVHVENILTKLGFKSRTQVATWVAERRANNDW